MPQFSHLARTPSTPLHQLRPVQHLNDLMKRYPITPKMVDFFLAQKGQNADCQWPDWCFLPMGYWSGVVSYTHKTKEFLPSLGAEISELAAIGTWRYSQGIYELDPELQEALVNSTISGKLPSDVFFQLPEFSVYIKTPGLSWIGEQLLGFWVHLDWGNKDKKDLRFLMDCEGGLVPFVLHLGEGTLNEAVDQSFAEAKQRAKNYGIDAPPELDEQAKLLKPSIAPLVSILLYLCSEEPEIDNFRLPGTSPKRSKPVKTKQGWRLFPPKSPTLWTVGTQIGEQLRAALKSEPGEATGRTVKTHLRRGHHHGFWTGPKKTPGERKLINRWLSPLIVRGRDDDFDRE